MANIRDLSSGKMSQEHSPQTKDKTSKQSSLKSAKSKTAKYLCLNLQSGKTQEELWETVTVSHGDSLMLSIGVFPREDNASTLSQILMESVQEKYYLSPRACLGILRRASSRGKELPIVLKKALERQATPSLMFENHSQDSRYTGPLDVSQTILSTFGMGGNNQPFVVQTPKTMKIRCGCEGGGKGALVQDDLSATLGTNNDQTLFQPIAFGVCSKNSNSMKSDNPKSGFYEADTSRTLDANGGNPTCNQGGIAVIEGNGTRPSHKGDGYKESDVMYTLNATEQHAVAFADVHATLSVNDGPKSPSSQMMGNSEEPSFGIGRPAMNQGYNAKFSFQIEEEVEPTLVAAGASGVAHPVYCTSKSSFHTSAEENLAGTLVASDYKDPPIVNEPQYIVRRLTPTECARLQGFPDWWCSDLGTKIPSEEELDFWEDVFETHRKVLGKSTKPKTRKQIFKWLQDPHSDSAEYKMWGNGVALPNVCFVLSGIVYYAQQSTE